MANIFLSYAREDSASARTLAAALKRAGHTVWWDRHIRGGAQYATEIEAALARAEVVVVLWSQSSVGSAWVRDEAVAARDSGRLVPVTLDRTAPPMGFRQYQAVDMSAWNGRGRPSRLGELIEAVAGIPGISPAGAKAAEEQESAPGLAGLGRWRLLFIALAIAAVGLAALQWLPRQSAGSAPTVAFVPAAAGNSARSRELAQSLSGDLSRLQKATAGSLAILGLGSAASRSADYIVQVAAYSDSAMSRADLNLTLPKTSEILWSATFDRPADAAADLRQQAAVELAAVLACLVEARTPKGKALATDVLKVHLEGCARLADLQEGRMNEEAAIVYRFVTENAPDFALGWANLARIEAAAIPGLTKAERRALWPVALEHAARARKLDPSLGEAYVAEAALTLPAEWGKKIRLYDRGLLADPGHPQLLRFRGETLMKVGRANEAVDNSRRAFERDPLSPGVRDSYISQLAYAGRPQAALKALEDAERIWPGATSIRDVRYRFDLRYGDPVNALRLLRERGSGELRPVSSDTSWESFLAARIDPSPKNVDTAVAAFMARYRRNSWDVVAAVQALGHFGRIDQAYAIMEPSEAVDGLTGAPEVLFRPDMRGFRSDPRFMRLAHRLGLLSYWQEARVWPDFCSDPQLPYDCAREAAKILRSDNADG